MVEQRQPAMHRIREEPGRWTLAGGVDSVSDIPRRRRDVIFRQPGPSASRSSTRAHASAGRGMQAGVSAAGEKRAGAAGLSFGLRGEATQGYDCP